MKMIMGQSRVFLGGGNPSKPLARVEERKEDSGSEP